MKIGSIYLAAGSSKRMGEAKLSMELASGITVGSRALLELRHSGVRPIIVVVRPEDPLLWLYDRRERHGALPKYRIAPCRDAHAGVSRSIKRGVQALMAEDADAALIALADQPFVSASLLRRLISVYRDDPAADFVACRYGEVVGPPVIFNKSLFPMLCALQGDSGAWQLLQSPEYRGKEVRHAAEWAFLDVDTMEQLEKAKRIWSRLQLKAK
ncbi:nucleotidyltransferase family protein [Paenibacillus montanisoli]|uniref:Xanthine dehydrogenase accessory protein PucB n=1 Tax=Paenibacillus montanisoli TaxID=2081970 RepID=A0A328UAE3_9BACL|nr:NTP transferase domain-containing protein [Paenibacillus montanisoli]RAP78271.1 xanthine dehydrogenase accessory protein PucB [Paenibacillus montanisoli]